MGLPMANLHAPSVASSSNVGGQNANASSRASISELMSRKENIEAELSALSSVLDSVGPHKSVFALINELHSMA